MTIPKKIRIIVTSKGEKIYTFNEARAKEWAKSDGVSGKHSTRDALEFFREQLHAWDDGRNVIDIEQLLILMLELYQVTA
jgi:hypothetical protein